MQALDALDPARFDTPAILKRLASASRALAELKGVAAAIPNQDILINNLFTHPYTKIDHVQAYLKFSGLTATKYMDAMAAGGFVRKQKMGRANYDVNTALTAILVRPRSP